MLPAISVIAVTLPSSTVIVAVRFSPLKPSALHAYVPSPLSVQPSPLALASVVVALELDGFKAASIIALTPLDVIVPPEIVSISSAEDTPINTDGSSNQSSPIPSPLLPAISVIAVTLPSSTVIVAVKFSPLNPSALHAYVPSPLSVHVAPLVDEALVVLDEEELLPLSVELVASFTLDKEPTRTIMTTLITLTRRVLLRILVASLI